MKATLRKILPAAVMAALLALLTACGGTAQSAEPTTEPARGGILEYGTDVQPAAGGIDPYMASSFAAQNIIVQIYESLLTKDRDGQLQSGLARSWNQLDETTYEFTLRDNATFSNGADVTARDVVFSFETMKQVGAAQKPLLSSLQSVTALDDDTIRFKLSRPSGAFLNLVASESTGVIVNETWYKTTPPAQRQRTALGTGPFQLTAWEDNVVISLLRNDHYWNAPKPYLDGVNFRILPDEQSRLASLRQGTVNAIWLGDQQLAEQAQGEGFTVGHNAETRNLLINVNAVKGPMANTKVRQALSKGIDRKQIALLATYGYGKLSQVVPVGDPNGLAPDGTTPNYTYDPDGAGKLLAETGTPNPTITITYASDASFARDIPLYEIMKEQLKKVGIELVLNPVPWADVLKRYIQGNYEGLLAVPGTAQADASSYFTGFLTPGMPTNQTGDAGKSATRMMTNLINEPDQTKRMQILGGLENEVAEQVLILVPYVVAQRQELWSPKLQGYDVDRYSYRNNLKNSWMAQ